MAAAQVFNVLTEFRFETGSAIASSGALQSAVENVSTAADKALISFEKLSLGIISNLTGGGGVLGLFATAIKSSEDFLKVQVALANVMGRGSGSFAERMDYADKKMANIVEKARKFGLPSEALAGITKILTPILAPKMGATKAIDTSIDLGRSFLKAAPTLGMDPFMAQDNLQRAMLGTIDAGDQLFMTLTQDTKAMAQFIGNADKFRKLPLAQRIKVLTEALDEFSGDMAVVERMANSVGGQMQILKDSLVGIGSILKPLGDVLSSVIVRILQRVNKFIQGDLKLAVENLALVVEPFTRDLKSLFATFIQLKSLQSDMKSAGGFIFNTGALLGVGHALKFLGINIPIISAALAGLAAVVDFFGKSLIGGAAGKILSGGFLTGVLGFFNSLFIFLTRVFVPLAALVALFQFFARVAAHVKIIFAETLMGFFERFSELGLIIGRVSAVFMQGFDALARFAAISPVMNIFFWFLDKLMSTLEYVTERIAVAVAAFQGLAFALMEMIIQIKNAIMLKGFNGAAIGDAFSGGVDMMLAELFPKIAAKIDDGSATPQQTVNISKIEIKNDFKEMLEPDRVAFTIKDQILKAARNSTSARGNGFSKAAAIQGGG
jgi:hypothetical protein